MMGKHYGLFTDRLEAVGTVLRDGVASTTPQRGLSSHNKDVNFRPNCVIPSSFTIVQPNSVIRYALPP